MNLLAEEKSIGKKKEKNNQEDKAFSSADEVLGYTTIGGLNVRKNPEKNSTRLIQIRKSGTQVILLGEEIKNNQVWYKIKCQGKIGYVLAEFVQQ